MVDEENTKKKEYLSSSANGRIEEVNVNQREVKVTVKIDPSEGETKSDCQKSIPESVSLPSSIETMEKDKIFASGKADSYNNDHLDSGLFPESPECQRNVQVMKPGIFLKPSIVTTESNRSQELVEHNSFDLSCKQLPVKKCIEAVNVEIVSDGKLEKLASRVQDKPDSQLGIKSAIIHVNKNPLNHFHTNYLHKESMYHQDHSHSVLSPQSINIAILPGNEHSRDLNKCTSSLSPVSSAPEIASDVLILEGKDSSTDHVEKGKPHVQLPYRMHEALNFGLRENEDGVPEDSLVLNFTNIGDHQHFQRLGYSTENLELNERVGSLPELDEPLQKGSYLSPEAVIAFQLNMPYLQGLEELFHHPLLSLMIDQELPFDLCSSFHLWNAFRVFIAGFVMYFWIN